MNKYKTSDMAFAAYLYHQKVEFHGVEPETERRKAFVFANTSIISDMKQDYFNGKAEVDPLEFYESIKRLKSFLYDNKRQ